jgi:signal transduction histidine kinase
VIPSTGFEFAVLLTSGVFLSVGGVVVRHRDSPGALPLAIVATLGALMGMLPVLSRIIGYDGSVFLPGFVLWPILVVAWFAFALAYTGRGPELTHRTIGVLVVISLLNVLLIPGNQAGLSGIVALIGVLSGVLNFTLGVVATAIIARSGLSGSDRRAGQTVALIGTGVMIVFLSSPIILRSLSGGRRRGLFFGALGVAALALSGGVLAGVLRTDPRTGHLARGTLLDQMDAAVIVTDANDRVLDLNNAAVTTFGLPQATAFGRTVGESIGDVSGIDSAGDRATRTLATVEGERRFEVTATTLSGSGDDAVRVAYILRDVTERHTDEQRIAALNRVLRHNLRNDLDAIRGFAEHLGDSDADSQQLARRVQGLAEDVVETGEQVAETEQLFARSNTSPERTDLGKMVREVAASLCADDSEPVSVDVTAADPVVQTEPGMLQPVVRELVTNAVVHATQNGDRDAVEVTIADAPEGLAVVVADRGPGIPPREQDVLIDGDESPLRHGSGLGLWLVHIGTMQIGGDLDYRERESGGAVVTLRVPDRDRVRQTPSSSTSDPGVATPPSTRGGDVRPDT